MNLRLSSGKELILDKDEIHMSPRAEGLKWLERYGKEMAMRELKDYADDELYAYKDRLKAKRIYGCGPEQTDERQKKREMLKKINAELRRRRLDTTRLDDCRVYGPGTARFQRAGREAAA